MINGEESDPYEETRERYMRVLYKLKVNEDPASRSMPHEEEFDDDNYESIEEKETAVWRCHSWFINFCIWHFICKPIQFKV